LASCQQLKFSLSKPFKIYTQALSQGQGP
jgi:hypothetical protein